MADLRGRRHADDGGGQRSAVLSGGVVRCQPGGQRFDGRPQLAERLQVRSRSGSGQPPANDVEVERVPFLRRQDGDSDPAADGDQPHRLQHPNGLPYDGAGDPELERPRRRRRSGFRAAVNRRRCPSPSAARPNRAAAAGRDCRHPSSVCRMTRQIPCVRRYGYFVWFVTAASGGGLRCTPSETLPALQCVHR